MKQKRVILSIMAVILTAFLFLDVSYAGNQTTSGVTSSVIITRARYYLNESTASFWSDAELLQFINDGTMDIVARTHCLETTETETITTGTTTYAISTTYLTVKGVVLNEDKSLRKGSIEHIGDTADLGEPAYYIEWNNNIVVYPAPASGVSGETLTTYLVSRPTTVTSSQAVQVPAQFNRALVLYVVAQALFKDEKFAKAGRFMAEYLSELDRFRLDFSYQQPAKDIR